MSEKTIPYKIYLEEEEMPKQWYNVRADMKNKPAPLLNPGTLQPITFEELREVFCDELARQELNDTDAYIDIPQEILDFYKMYRPSPLVRAYCLERSWIRRLRSIINLRATIRAAAISSTRPSRRHIMRSSRVLQG